MKGISCEHCGASLGQYRGKRETHPTCEIYAQVVSDPEISEHVRQRYFNEWCAEVGEDLLVRRNLEMAFEREYQPVR